MKMGNIDKKDVVDKQLLNSKERETTTGIQYLGLLLEFNI